MNTLWWIIYIANWVILFLSGGVYEQMNNQMGNGNKIHIWKTLHLLELWSLYGFLFLIFHLKMDPVVHENNHIFSLFFSQKKGSNSANINKYANKCSNLLSTSSSSPNTKSHTHIVTFSGITKKSHQIYDNNSTIQDTSLFYYQFYV